MTTNIRPPKTVITMNLNTDQVLALRALSNRTRIPQSAYLREAITYILRKHGQEAAQ